MSRVRTCSRKPWMFSNLMWCLVYEPQLVCVTQMWQREVRSSIFKAVSYLVVFVDWLHNTFHFLHFSYVYLFQGKARHAPVPQFGGTGSSTGVVQEEPSQSIRFVRVLHYTTHIPYLYSTYATSRLLLVTCLYESYTTQHISPTFILLTHHQDYYLLPVCTSPTLHNTYPLPLFYLRNIKTITCYLFVRVLHYTTHIPYLYSTYASSRLLLVTCLYESYTTQHISPTFILLTQHQDYYLLPVCTSPTLHNTYPLPLFYLRIIKTITCYLFVRVLHYTTHIPYLYSSYATSRLLLLTCLYESYTTQHISPTFILLTHHQDYYLLPVCTSPTLHNTYPLPLFFLRIIKTITCYLFVRVPTLHNTYPLPLFFLRIIKTITCYLLLLVQCLARSCRG